jgi:hypothetical protein
VDKIYQVDKIFQVARNKKSGLVENLEENFGKRPMIIGEKNIIIFFKKANRITTLTATLKVCSQSPSSMISTLKKRTSC